MTAGQQDQPGQGKRGKVRKGTYRGLVAHRAFAPMLGLWGALLAGLSMLVVPPTMIEAAASGTLLATLGLPAQLTIALLAALVLGGGLFALAFAMTSAARRRADAPSVAEFAARRVRPINPVRDLGTRSLDEPIVAMPFATPAWREETVAEPAPQPEPAAPAPHGIELSEFADLPGRNGVWVEEPDPAAADHSGTEPAPLPEPAPEPVLEAEPVPAAPDAVRRIKPAVPPVHPSAAALARLRSVPTSELSIVQMVERFAGALHEHRTSPPGKALSAQDIAVREAALAEALRALATLSGKRASDSENEPLQAAIARLQGIRGAA